MIFRKSLSKKKGAAYSFFSGLSSAFIPSILITLCLSLFMAVLPVVVFLDAGSGERNLTFAQLLEKIRESYKFYVLETIDGNFSVYLILGILGILAIFCAVRIFSFICDKKTVNVYYSLGIKRSVLFMSKYLAGALLLCIAAAVPVILSYIVNLIFVGASWQLSLVLIHFYCGLSVFLLICYSITAAVFSSVGTVSEAIVYSVAVLFAPTIIIFITENIIAAFLPSSTLNMYFEFFNDTRHHYNSDASLVEATVSYNPLLFFANELIKYASAALNNGELTLENVKTGWEFPNIFISFLWFIPAVGAGALGALLFKRIKAENCGFLNTNKILSNLTIFELCLFGSSILLSEIEWNGTAVTLGIGAAAAFALYILAEIFLKRSFIRILKSLYKFAAHMAVIAIIFTVCATGAFGYGEYIPDKAAVDSVEISVPLSYSQITTKSLNCGWMSNSFLKIYDQYHPMFMPEMTDSADIDKVIEINRKLNQIEGDDGYNNQIIIRYNLKKGGYSERRHLVSTAEEYELLFTLFDTNAYKNELKKLFYEFGGVEELRKEQAEHDWVDNSSIKRLAFDYEYSTVTARAPSLQENRVLDLTKEEFTELKNAAYKDLSAQTGRDYLLANYRQIGILSFDVNEKAYKIEGVNNYNEYIPPEEDMTDAVPPAEELPEDELFPEDGLFPEDELFPENDFIPEEESPYISEDTAPYNALGGFEYESGYDIIITDNMSNTLAVLEKLGIKDCFTSNLTVESISFREYSSEKLFGISGQETLIKEFFSYPVLKEEFMHMHDGGDSSIEDNYTENKITDKEKLTALEPLMKLHEFTFDSGYICLIKYTGDSYCIRYLSREDAPDYVKNFNYTMNESVYYYY